MKTILTAVGTLILVMLVGCASLSKKNNLSIFEDVQLAYRLALRDADFKAAGLVLDPATQTGEIDYQRFESIKVVQYKASKMKVSDDGKEIRQEVEIQYYHQTHPVVKTLLDNQLWRYQPANRNWLLQTGLPEFK